MAPVAVEIGPAPAVTGENEEIEFVDDASSLLDHPAIVPGCGDSNPYQQ
jgi:hypothetical protein